jgi:biopolymer transport protein TolR
MGVLIQSKQNSRSKRHINSEINVTPFVDVMLVLLVIFMVTSPMLITGVNVDLPKTKSAPLAGQDEPLAITVNKNGEIFIQETKVLIENLTLKLKAILGEKKDTRIFVRGDQRVDYGKVIQVFASIKEAGFSNVALVTEMKEEVSK